MEALSKVKNTVAGKAKEKIFDSILGMLENIDVFDQLTEMVKASVPAKVEITVKGKKALEVNFKGIKDGQLWISVKRIREQKPAEPETEEDEE